MSTVSLVRGTCRMAAEMITPLDGHNCPLPPTLTGNAGLALTYCNACGSRGATIPDTKKPTNQPKKNTG